MSRPNFLKQPRNINLIVENDEYEQILEKCQPSGFSSYIRDLMRNDHLVKTTELIYQLRDEIEQKDRKIENLQDTILKMAQEVPKSSKTIEAMIQEHSLGKAIYCPSCGIQNVKLKGGQGRKCHGCGAWIV